MIELHKLSFLQRGKPSSLLGLALDAGRLEGVVLRRTNGSLQAQPPFVAPLSLDPLTNDPELVGQEIRNHLDRAGVRERHCAVAIPLKWALVTHTTIPELPEGELPGFLQIEAERGFPCDVGTLLVAASRHRSASGAEHATLVGIPRSHLALLEKVLRAAQLRPVSFSLGLAALQAPWAENSEGVMALSIGETHVGLQITCGGGVAALRALEGAIDLDGGHRKLQAGLVAREARITLGQLPADLRDSVRRVRIFGSPEMAHELAAEFKARYEPAGLKVELAEAYGAREFGVQVPMEAGVSPAFSLAAWHLAGRGAPFELLPPKISAWQQVVARYSSGSLQRAAVAAGAVGLLAASLFGFQQWQLWRLGSQWRQIKPRVLKLEATQQKIREFRPWFDESLRTLSILRQLTEAFPEDGVVSAKSVEIRDQGTVTCMGTARDNQALLKTMERLRAASAVADLKVDQIRGKSPMQFTFEFRWSEGKEP
jgi:hypothetical protein